MPETEESSITLQYTTFEMSKTELVIQLAKLVFGLIVTGLLVAIYLKI